MGRRGLHIILISGVLLARQPGVVHAQAYITNMEPTEPLQYTRAVYASNIDYPVLYAWNNPLNFNLHCENGGRTSPECLHIDLCNTMPDRSSWVIGSSRIPLERFLAVAGEAPTAFLITYSWPVSTGDSINFSYRLGAYVSPVPRSLSTVVSFVLDSDLWSILNFGFHQPTNGDDDNIEDE